MSTLFAQPGPPWSALVQYSEASRTLSVALPPSPHSPGWACGRLWSGEALEKLRGRHRWNSFFFVAAPIRVQTRSWPKPNHEAASVHSRFTKPLRSFFQNLPPKWPVGMQPLTPGRGRAPHGACSRHAPGRTWTRASQSCCRRWNSSGRSPNPVVFGWGNSRVPAASTHGTAWTELLRQKHRCAVWCGNSRCAVHHVTARFVEGLSRLPGSKWGPRISVDPCRSFPTLVQNVLDSPLPPPKVGVPLVS